MSLRDFLIRSARSPRSKKFVVGGKASSNCSASAWRVRLDGRAGVFNSAGFADDRLKLGLGAVGKGGLGEDDSPLAFILRIVSWSVICWVKTNPGSSGEKISMKECRSSLAEASCECVRLRGMAGGE